jgi:flagellar FliL protein
MLRIKTIRLLLAITGILCSLPSFAEDAAPKTSYGYYGFTPDIITNYIAKGKTLGYIRVTVEIMVSHDTDIEKIDQHAPLLRDAIIQILGRQPLERIKSLTGREEIRAECLLAVNELLIQEAGDKLAKDLLFTKYLYQ